MSAPRFALLGVLFAALFTAACSGSEDDPSFEEILEGAGIDGGSADGGPESPGGAPRLTVTLEGDGLGQITSAPDGIDCGSTCNAAFELESVVTLVATPQENSEFAGWAGACSGGASSCDLDFEGDTAVRARFTLKRHPVSLNYGGDGTGEATVEVLEGPACSGEPCAYAEGSRLRLSATPSADSQFSGWNGVPCGIEPVCEVEVTGELSIEALFAKQERGLAVVLEGAGKGRVHSDPLGIDCPDSCAANWKVGSVLSLTAEADEESSRFAGWTGATCSGDDLVCQITLNETNEVHADFALLTRTLDVQIGGNGQGRVTAKVVPEEQEGAEEPQEIIRCGMGETDCEELLDHGTKVELSLTPSAGSGFNWGGACAGQTTATCTVDMTEARDVQANFLLQPRALTVTVTGSGAGRVNGVVAGNQAVVSCGDGGSDCAETVNHGTNIVLSAAPTASSTFAGWGGACSGTGACTVSMTEARSVSASFTLRSYNLAVTKTGNGSGTVTGTGIDCGADCGQSFNHGATVTLTASPSANSNFGSWGGACSGAGTCTVSVTEARNVSANFTLKTYPLSVTRTGNGNGSVSGTNITCGADCSDTFTHGTAVALSATPNADSDFTGWSGACSGTGACSVSMTQARDVTANFTLKTHALSVAKTGTGTGTVSGTGIACGADCSETFAHGADVTLSATSDASSTFTGWSGACSGTGACTVDMTQARSVTANFELLTPTLTVTKSGSGTGTVQGPDVSCGADCSQTYNYDTSVTLTASADPSSTFSGWTGACTGTGTCTVSMTQARSVGASFALRSYVLAVTRAGNGAGTVTGGGINCGSDCSRTFDHGTDVVLSAATVGDSVFAGWSGACSGTGTCTVDMTQARNVTATFTLNSYALSVTRGGSGSGNVTGGAINCGTTCSATFDSATNITLTASPDASSTFSGWAGACSGTTNTCTVAMTQSRSVTANFAIRTFTLAVSKDGNGTGTVSGGGLSCGATCSDSYEYDTNVTLVASADASSTFTGWIGACSGTGSCVVNMRQARAVTATFSLRTPALTVARAGTGLGTVTGAGIDCGADCGETYNYGTDVTLTASPDASSTFTGWSGACTGTGDCTVDMTQARAVTANFTLRTPTLSVTKPGTGTGSVTGLGIDCGADCTETYNYGTDVTLSASADASSTFTGWGGACSGSGTCTVDMTQARSVSATFALRTLRLAVSKAGTGTGTVAGGPISCGATCSAELNYDADVTLTATADASSTFAGWSGACTGTGTCVVDMTQARSVTATFTRRTPGLTVTTVGTGGGTVNSSPAGINCGNTCNSNFDYGATVTLTASPNTISTFGGWSGACSGTGSCVVEMTQLRNVSATFTLNTYALNVNRAGTAGAGGYVATSNGSTGIDCGPACSASYSHGTNVTLTATPGAGANFMGWSGACTGRTNPCVVAMTQIQNVTATFTLGVYTLNVTRAGNAAGTGYVVTSNGSTGIDCGTTCSANYDYGTNVTLTARAGGGSAFTGWSGPCSGTGTCTVPITQTQNVTATFTLNRYALNVSKGGSGAGTVTTTGVATGIDCGTDCTETYNYGTSVTLTAVAARGSRFTGWAGECTGTGTCIVSMNGLRNVTANFVLTYALSVTRGGNGSGTVTGTGINCGSDCAQTFDTGASVTLTAATSASSNFTGWSGACTGTATTCTVSMTQARSVTATFALKQYRVSVRVSGSGYGEQDVRIQGTDVDGDPLDTTCYVNYPTQARTCTYTFNHGTSVTLTARPYGSTNWDSWSTSGTRCTGTNRTCSFTVTGTQSETAIFWDLI